MQYTACWQISRTAFPRPLAPDYVSALVWLVQRWQNLTELGTEWEYRRDQNHYEGLLLHSISPQLANTLYPWLLRSETEAIVTLLQVSDHSCY